MRYDAEDTKIARQFEDMTFSQVNKVAKEALEFALSDVRKMTRAASEGRALALAHDARDQARLAYIILSAQIAALDP